MAQIKKVTGEVKSKIKALSADSLPDNPSARGKSAADIKKAFFEPIVGGARNVIEEIDRVVGEANNIIGSDTLKTTAQTLVGAINEHEGDIGSVGSLTTSKKTLVGAINENKSDINKNKGNIGTLTDLKTKEKASLVGAINENKSAIDQNKTAISTNKGAIGTLADLKTKEKASLVGAINENKDGIANRDKAISTLQDRLTGYETVVEEHGKNKAAIDEHAALIQRNASKIDTNAREIKSLRDTVNGIENAYVFDSFEKLIGIIEKGEVAPFETGDSIYFVEQGVPDFWFEKTTDPKRLAAAETYTYKGVEYPLIAKDSSGATAGNGIFHILEGDTMFKGNLSNALKGRVQGNPIALTDVSPITHDIVCRVVSGTESVEGVEILVDADGECIRRYTNANGEFTVPSAPDVTFSARDGIILEVEYNKDINDFVTTGDSIVLGEGAYALGDHSVAIGEDVVAGCKAYYIRAIDTTNKKIYLSNERVAAIDISINTDTIDEDNRDVNFEMPRYLYGQKLDGEDGEEYDSRFTIINGSHYDMIAKIVGLENNVVTYDGDLGFGEIADDDSEIGYTFRVPSQPTIGIVSVSDACVAFGKNNYASGENTFVSGCDNKALGAYSYAEGLRSEARGKVAHAEGYEAQANGDYSHAEGYSSAIGVGAHSEGAGAVVNDDGTTTINHGGTATGNGSHAEGSNTTASGEVSHAEGGDTTASGTCSHAEGFNTVAEGSSSHSEGGSTYAKGIGAHAEGGSTKALGDRSHAEGDATIAGGDMSHAEGWQTQANGKDSHAEGRLSKAGSQGSHVEGWGTATKAGETYAAITSFPDQEGSYAHAEGVSSLACGHASHAEGLSTTASGKATHAEGYNTAASGTHSHAEGSNVEATKPQSHAEGNTTHAIGDNTHAEGWNTTASNQSAHAEGRQTTASGKHSHAEGWSTTASGDNSHAEGNRATADAIYSHAEGYNTTSSGEASHSEGYDATASGKGAHAEGKNTEASHPQSHAEGDSTKATANNAHAEGYLTTASGENSHAEGKQTIAAGETQHVQGKFNVEDSEGKYAHIVGNGSASKRSNAHTVDWNGTGWFAKEVKVGGTGQDDSSAKRLVTMDEVSDKFESRFSTLEKFASSFVETGFVSETIYGTEYTKIPDGALPYAQILEIRGDCSTGADYLGYGAVSANYPRKLLSDDGAVLFEITGVSESLCPYFGLDPDNYIYFKDGKAIYHQAYRLLLASNSSGVDIPLEEGESVAWYLYDHVNCIKLKEPIETDITDQLGFDGVINVRDASKICLEMKLSEDDVKESFSYWEDVDGVPTYKREGSVSSYKYGKIKLAFEV